jgi:hypothetical protein
MLYLNNVCNNNNIKVYTSITTTLVFTADWRYILVVDKLMKDNACNVMFLFFLIILVHVEKCSK